jgi:hypothetical protein
MEIDWNDWFYYDETSPSCIRWKVDRYKGKNFETPMVKAGDVAGSICANGYWRVGFRKKQYKVHRIIWFLMHGFHPVKVDHKDGNKLNNFKSNLRHADGKINRRNVKKAKNNSSGVTGVTFTGKVIEGKNYQYWYATWNDITGQPMSKVFSVLVHGYDEAFRLACEYRARMIEELNRQGAGYTERHGT